MLNFCFILSNIDFKSKLKNNLEILLPYLQLQLQQQMIQLLLLECLRPLQIRILQKHFLLRLHRFQLVTLRLLIQLQFLKLQIPQPLELQILLQLQKRLQQHQEQFCILGYKPVLHLFYFYLSFLLYYPLKAQGLVILIIMQFQLELNLNQPKQNLISGSTRIVDLDLCLVNKQAESIKK